MQNLDVFVEFLTKRDVKYFWRYICRGAPVDAFGSLTECGQQQDIARDVIQALINGGSEMIANGNRKSYRIGRWEVGGV